MVIIPTTILVYDSSSVAILLSGHQRGKTVDSYEFAYEFWDPAFATELSKTFLNDVQEIQNLLKQIGFERIRSMGSRARRTYTHSSWGYKACTAHITKHSKYGTPKDDGEFYRLLLWNLVPATLEMKNGRWQSL